MHRAALAPRLTRLALLGLAACVTRPTGVLVTIDTDLSATRTLLVTVEAFRGRTAGDGSTQLLTITRGGTADPVALPTSFGLVPRLERASREAAFADAARDFSRWAVSPACAPARLPRRLSHSRGARLWYALARATMNTSVALYGSSLALLTDLYQLTMAYGYWKSGTADHEAVFNLFFRKHPFKGGYTVACGLQYAIDYLERFRFAPDDLGYLAELRGNDGAPLFDPKFLDMLGALRFSCDVDAIPEGTAVFPQEPLVRVRGPILQCQLLETPLLNLINFQTLIATKAARVCEAARGEPVLEFGLRRAQGIDGALAASRAAYAGGCAATSNVLAGKIFGIPVRGTHAHSWVMSFDDELEAFQAYARAMPNNCVFLVDTYDTLEGVKKAVEVGRWLRAQGHELAGVRLDSGDLAYLSIEARKILDAGGFPKASIVASNDLDETIIESLKLQGATIAVWGVGTKLVTAYDQPALGGVYKLSAVRETASAKWRYRLKLSEQAVKISNPGIQQVRRFVDPDDGHFVADMIYDEELGVTASPTMIDPFDLTRRRTFGAEVHATDLLTPVFRGGKLVAPRESMDAVRARGKAQLAALHPTIRRFTNPHQYPVGLEQKLYDMKTELVLKARGLDSAAE